jgi:hypothetical protein
LARKDDHSFSVAHQCNSPLHEPLAGGADLGRDQSEEAIPALFAAVDDEDEGVAVGATLVVFGIAINVGAAVKLWTTIRRLERGQPLRFRPWSLGMIVALLLLAL